MSHTWLFIMINIPNTYIDNYLFCLNINSCYNKLSLFRGSFGTDLTFWVYNDFKTEFSQSNFIFIWLWLLCISPHGCFPVKYVSKLLCTYFWSQNLLCMFQIDVIFRYILFHMFVEKCRNKVRLCFFLREKRGRTILPYFGKRKQVTYHPNLSYWCFHNSHNELFFYAKFHAETLILLRDM